ncbi:DUF6777 domain-containing protein [Kitasatospora sp. NPDC058965]|uniref:DUF6777 domain-containing protein n=1 Tax=Kitasatospora sp. NPDC058965 TaxID=3346682 RepID=UPI00369DF4D2
MAATPSAEPPGTPVPPGPPGPPSRTLAGAPGGGDGGQPWWQRPRTLAMIGGGLVLVAGLTVLLVARQPKGNHPTAAATGAPKVTLQAAAAPGQDPYTGSVSASGSASGAATTVTATATATPPVPAGGGTADGAAVGLYGGTLHNSSCDVAQLTGFLATHADKGKAWAGVEGIDPTAIPDYLHSLSSAVLRVDTRVTNHGFANGAATSFQSVLEEGSAVLVDNHGVPRVRCACGNPLTPPLADTATPAYVGSAWPGFRPEHVVTVRPAPAPASTLVLVDQSSGTYFTRPVGGGGGATGDHPTTPPAGGASGASGASSAGSSSHSAGGSSPAGGSGSSAGSPAGGGSASAGRSAGSGGSSGAGHSSSAGNGAASSAGVTHASLGGVVGAAGQ